MQDKSFCAETCRPSAPCWAEKLRASLDRNYWETRLAADHCRYTNKEFANYYGKHAPAMWRQAGVREIHMACWCTFARRMTAWSLRRWLLCIRWRRLTCNMASWTAMYREAALRQLVDIRNGARRRAPWDEPATQPPPMEEARNEYNEENEEYESVADIFFPWEKVVTITGGG